MYHEINQEKRSEKRKRLYIEEKAEETQEVLTLSESAAWIYEHVEEADSVKVLAELLSEEYGIRAEEVLQDVQEVIDFLQEKGVVSPF